MELLEAGQLTWGGEYLQVSQEDKVSQLYAKSCVYCKWRGGEDNTQLFGHSLNTIEHWSLGAREQREGGHDFDSDPFY